MKRRGVTGVALIVALCAFPAVLYLVTTDWTGNGVSDSFILIGRTLGMAGFTAFAINLFMGGRFWFVERLFGGLDRMYKVHRKVGETAFGLLTAHFACILIGYWLTMGTGSFFLFKPSTPATFFAVLALVTMGTVLLLTLYGRLNHEMFIYVHRLFGVVFLVGIYHVFWNVELEGSSEVENAYLQGVAVIGVAGYLYRSVLGKTLVRRIVYRVAKVNRLDEFVTEVIMAPEDKHLRYKPGQFVFVTFESRGIHDEFHPMDVETEAESATVTLRPGAVRNQAHPFSITSAPDAPHLSVAVKALGDFTKAMRALEVGARVYVEGPYGSFSHLNIGNRKQIWIAGGIGVTPFLSMARSLTEDDWEIDFYYAMETGSQKYFIEDFYELGDQNPRVRTIPIQHDQLGHVTAEDIEAVSRDLPEKDILICGPPPMMFALRSQLRAKGVPDEQIHFEEFGFANVRHVPRKH